MVCEMNVRTKHRFVIKFLYAKNVAPVDIYRYVLKIYGDQTGDESAVKLWVLRLSIGETNVCDKQYFKRPCPIYEEPIENA